MRKECNTCNNAPHYTIYTIQCQCKNYWLLSKLRTTSFTCWWHRIQCHTYTHNPTIPHRMFHQDERNDAFASTRFVSSIVSFYFNDLFWLLITVRTRLFCDHIRFDLCCQQSVNCIMLRSKFRIRCIYLTLITANLERLCSLYAIVSVPFHFDQVSTKWLLTTTGSYR